jgi:hypothetical protein
MAALGKEMKKPVQKGFTNETSANADRLARAIFKRLGA